MFIVFEGTEGSGKTAVVKEIINKLEQEGVDVILTREPGGTPIAEKIRGIILDPENKEMDAATEALLYAAARSQHTKEKIIPALCEDKVVICDRYIGSSFAYQGYARELGPHNILEINQFAGFLKPDLTIFLDVSPQESFKRIQHKNKDRLEQAGIEFHEKVYDGYKRTANLFKWNSIDASQSLEQVINDCWKIIHNEVKEKHPN